MSELYYPNLDDEELLRIAQDSTDPLVEELVKRLAKQLDVKEQHVVHLETENQELGWKVNSLEQKLEGCERELRETKSELTSLEVYIDRKRGLKD